MHFYLIERMVRAIGEHLIEYNIQLLSFDGVADTILLKKNKVDRGMGKSSQIDSKTKDAKNVVEMKKKKQKKKLATSTTFTHIIETAVKNELENIVKNVFRICKKRLKKLKKKRKEFNKRQK